MLLTLCTSHGLLMTLPSQLTKTQITSRQGPFSRVSTGTFKKQQYGDNMESISETNIAVTLFESKNDDEFTITISEAAVQQMWNWCYYFVIPLKLCPWAARSVTTPGAMRFYLVNNADDFSRAIARACREFDQTVLDKVAKATRDSDESAAIYFVVLIDKASVLYQDFGLFYEWYTDWEDEWLDNNYDESGLNERVTLAPFHPYWTYVAPTRDDNDDAALYTSLDVEKHSPYPAVSIVSSEVIERAGGPAITQIIAKQNQDRLQTRSYQDWNEIHQQSLREGSQKVLNISYKRKRLE